jgi:hypothetical protein
MDLGRGSTKSIDSLTTYVDRHRMYSGGQIVDDDSDSDEQENQNSIERTRGNSMIGRISSMVRNRNRNQTFDLCNSEHDANNIVLTRVLVPALSAVPATIVHQTMRYTMNLNSRSVLRVTELPEEYITARQSAVTEQTIRLRNYEHQIDELVNKARVLHIDLSLADNPIKTGSPVFLPSVANLLRLEEGIVPAENNMVKVVNRTVTRAVSGGASIAIKAPSFMTITGSGSVIKSVAKTTSKYADKRSDFESMKLVYGYMLNEINGARGSDLLAVKAREYLKKVTSRDYLVQDVDRLMIARRLKMSKDYPKSKDMFSVHYFRWRHDVQLSSDPDAIPTLLERVATYSQVPFWMINAYRGSPDVVETQIYRRSEHVKDEFRSGQTIRTVNYRVVSTDSFSWSQVRRVNLTRNSMPDNENEILSDSWRKRYLSSNNMGWSNTLLGTGEKYGIPNEDNAISMMLAGLPMMLGLCLACDGDISNWAFGQCDSHEVNVSRNDVRGISKGRVALVSHEGNRSVTMDDESCVILMYNKRGGRNHDVDLWI